MPTRHIKGKSCTGQYGQCRVCKEYLEDCTGIDRRHPYRTPAHRALRELAHVIVKHWGPYFSDPNAPISGADAADSLGSYVQLAKDALSLDKPKSRRRKS